MKVVMVSKALVTEAYRRKAEKIAALGVDLTVIVPPTWRDSRGTHTVGDRNVHGYKLVVAPLLFNGHFHIHFYPNLTRLLVQNRPDILHMDEEPYNLATWLALRAAHAQRIPALFFSWQNIARRVPPPFCWLESDNYQRAACAIAGSAEAASVLQKKGFGGPISIIPQFGVDPTIFRPAQAHHAGNNNWAKPLQIGYAGGLLPEKGIETLLHACAMLHGHWRLRIVGSGKHEAQLRKFATMLDIEDQVRFDARLNSLEMPAFYQGLDVFVLPSRTMPNWKEQFGRVLIEAMSCGVVAVGSDSGEIPNVIGNAGYIFPEGNSLALHDRLQTLLESPEERQAFGRAGRQRVLSHYTMQQVAQETVQVYGRMIGSSL